MLDVLLSPVIAAAVLGTLFFALFKGRIIPRSFSEALPHFVVGAVAGMLGAVFPSPRIEDVSVVVKLIPLVTFSILAVVAFIRE